MWGILVARGEILLLMEEEEEEDDKFWRDERLMRVEEVFLGFFCKEEKESQKSEGGKRALVTGSQE